MNNEYQLIVTIIDRGLAEEVMTAAREAGAKGGTVVHARGTGSHETEKIFGIVIHPEKDVILIIARTCEKDAIMTAIGKSTDIDAANKGVSFSLPLDSVYGLYVPSENSTTSTDGEAVPSEVLGEEDNDSKSMADRRKV